MHLNLCLPTYSILQAYKLSLLIFSLQSTAVIPLLLWMAPLNHIKTQLRELRYFSDVIQCLSQLGGRQQCVEQMEGGALTLLITGAHVSIYLNYVHDITMHVCIYACCLIFRCLLILTVRIPFSNLCSNLGI